MPYVCWLEYSDHSGINEDSMMILQLESEADFYLKVVQKTCGSDIPHKQFVEIEKRLSHK